MTGDQKELIAFRIARANSTLAEVDILIEHSLWHTSISLIYYACFYAVTALLSSRNFHAKSHAGVKQIFGLEFVKTGLIDKELGRFYSNIFEMRQEADYADLMDYDKDDVLRALPKAKKLIAEIEKILKDIPNAQS